MNNPKSEDPATKLAERIAQLSTEKRGLFKQQLAAKRPRGYDVVATSLRTVTVVSPSHTRRDPTKASSETV